jgi:hypothetical protein
MIYDLYDLKSPFRRRCADAGAIPRLHSIPSKSSTLRLCYPGALMMQRMKSEPQHVVEQRYRRDGGYEMMR